MKTKLYKISKGIAREKGIPMIFAANELTRTTKALYLYGRGSMEARVFNVCMSCGRTLTHPVSVLAGIGPECGQHYWNWDFVGGYTEENLAKIKGAIENIKVDTWLPLYCIQEIVDCEEIINTPADHAILKRQQETPTQKIASLVTDKSTRVSYIKAVFPYCINTINHIKGIPGRKFVSEGSGAKYWIVPLEYADNMKGMGFEFDEALQTYVSQKQAMKETLDKIPPKYSEEIKGLKGTPYPYQLEGAWKMHKKQGNLLLADDMGLGKTLQALAFLQLNPEKRPVIIVMPASVKFNWLAECEKWLPFPKAQILQGTDTTVPITGEIILINYDIVKYWEEKLKAIKAKVLILDECHYIKNSAAQRTKALKRLAKVIPCKIPMSGTPIENRPMEIFNALNMIDPQRFSSMFEFGKKYCAGKHNGYGWDFTGASNLYELHNILKENHLMIRRLKKDVLPELPEKTLSYMPMELNNYKEYRQAHNSLIEYLTETKGKEAAIKASKAEQLAQIEVLKSIAAKGKLDDCIEIVRDVIDSGKKIAVFANHTFVIEAFMQAFPNIAVKIDGSVPTDKRHEIATRFQTDDTVRLFVGNIKAAAEGITLTAADTMMVVELPWTPGKLKQVIDRLVRIGQTRGVMVMLPIVAGTIEEKIAKLLQTKEQFALTLIDGQQDTGEDNGNILNELISQLTNN